MKEDLFDSFLTLLSRIICPNSSALSEGNMRGGSMAAKHITDSNSPIYPPPAPTLQDYVQSPETIVLQDNKQDLEFSIITEEEQLIDENPKKQVLVTNENIDDLIKLGNGTTIEVLERESDFKPVEQPIDNIGIEVKGKTNEPVAKFNESKFDESNFE